ncbi:adenosine deaminase [Roseinatronobacter bogoriensis]|uniref:Adenosine deaminase n=1 Tax=Roseinatronobacter bogoriensis subsp. barguzinensis TaxID=441209 RepID=A0A2K8K8Q9_9RHOB|nr:MULTISPECIES: adenosine deaminase [Rhodobaca]ATX65837.1 adenosine deaminase [Rhodobaca barguzinensis]MBB4208202.1 adenosine deaminase [Rhodobaca bogoriensis DSM 18756]TDW38843.1 adenosine deaminase [Rhodobaca barguzinensis]TDY68974.1 adenosine deaminase [Rhodobaca bogoriensis DSM 18756]
MIDLRPLPKVELHLHLEGAAPPEFIRSLAARKKVDLSKIFDERGNYAYSDFPDFLRVYEAACTVLTNPQDFHDLTLAVLEQSASHNVLYSEAFLSPDFCGGGDLIAWRDYLAAMEAAAATAEAQVGITLRGCITCIRHFGPVQARQIARCAQETAGAFITGFGIAGDETQFHPREFAYAFDAAREAGLGLTAHAGEWGGPDSVRDALEHLRVSRIGHGVRAIEDDALVAHLAESGTVLEVCPGSNSALGLYPQIIAHPIDKLRRKGVLVTVSTDDPPFFHTDMTREYQGLANAFNWQDEDFAQINNTALNAAFCDAQTRTALCKKLEAK